MKSVMQHAFSTIPQVDIPRSVFDRSHGHKTTFNAGYLVPFYCDEALPGDTFRARASLFARLSTPIVPIMDNLFMETFYFAVPIRLIWTNFQKFMGEKVEVPIEAESYLVPRIYAPAETGFEQDSIFDHFGLPVEVPGIKVSALWSRAYNLIYNEWFRDQNWIEPITVDKDDGPDSYSDYPMQRRGKRHDYFTSALPWPQKGSSIPLPLGGTAPVIGNGNTLGLETNSDYWGLVTQYGLPNSMQISTAAYELAQSTSTTITGTPTGLHTIGVSQQASGSGLIADLTNATAATINGLRQAFQLQKMHEKDARGGSRYIEIIKNHFRVDSPDARLQRPEYLGGSSCRININPVQQTSSTDATTPQGNLAAFAVASDNHGGFSKSFVEHCVILGLVNVRADLTYQQGIPRMFSRRTRYDFYWPSLAYLGEQEIYEKEIFAIGEEGSEADDSIFGYQERWAEYRYFPSQITGKFRSDVTDHLDYWHLSQQFISAPPLGQDFIEDHTDDPLNRAIAVQEQSEPQIIFDSYMELHCARPMPVFSVPGLIDHF